MTITVENLSDLQHKLRVLPEEVTKAAVTEIQATGVRIRDKAQSRTRSDTTRASIKKRRAAKGLNAIVNVGHWKGRFEEFGTKAHVIRPRNKKVLAGPEFGPVGRAVQHPGQDANPFLLTSAEEERRDFPQRLATVINDATAKVARR